jgi:CheY-like chemotaxis protein
MDHLFNVPFVIITAEIGNDIQQAALEAKAALFVSKPLRDEDLKNILESFNGST